MRSGQLSNVSGENTKKWTRIDKINGYVIQKGKALLLKELLIQVRKNSYIKRYPYKPQP